MRAKNPPCQQCGGPHQFDTTVPSVRWNAVIRAQGLPDYLCTACILKAFAKAGESFTATLWGQGFGGLSVLFQIGGKPAMDAMTVSKENTELRARIRELEEQQKGAV